MLIKYPIANGILFMRSVAHRAQQKHIHFYPTFWQCAIPKQLKAFQLRVAYVRDTQQPGHVAICLNHAVKCASRYNLQYEIELKWIR